MTPDDIIARVAHIETLRKDPKSAHWLEDELHRAVLRYLADEGNELARLALTTRDIDFARWYA